MEDQLKGEGLRLNDAGDDENDPQRAARARGAGGPVGDAADDQLRWLVRRAALGAMPRAGQPLERVAARDAHRRGLGPLGVWERADGHQALAPAGPWYWASPNPRMGKKMKPRKM